MSRRFIPVYEIETVKFTLHGYNGIENEWIGEDYREEAEAALWDLRVKENQLTVHDSQNHQETWQDICRTVVLKECNIIQEVEDWSYNEDK